MCQRKDGDPVQEKESENDNSGENIDVGAARSSPKRQDSSNRHVVSVFSCAIGEYAHSGNFIPKLCDALNAASKRRDKNKLSTINIFEMLETAISNVKAKNEHLHLLLLLEGKTMDKNFVEAVENFAQENLYSVQLDILTENNIQSFVEKLKNLELCSRLLVIGLHPYADGSIYNMTVDTDNIRNRLKYWRESPWIGKEVSTLHTSKPLIFTTCNEISFQ